MKSTDSDPGFGPLERENARVLIEMAVREDLGDASDITGNATIPADWRFSARFVTRSPGVIAGLPVLSMLAARFGLEEGLTLSVEDGDTVSPGTTLATIKGQGRAILALERTALNFLQRLSGVATLTARFVAETEGTDAQILDTRKTTPGWRHLEKYAVRCGGGVNHRIGLFDAALIKDNHLAFLAGTGDPIGESLKRTRASAPLAKFHEVEVDTLDGLDRALQCAPDIILVDNFSLDDVAEAVRRRNRVAQTIRLEASGGISLEMVKALARTGVDRISVGALTHSAPALDIGLDVAP